MIISISGGIGSGKDTIASYLINNHGFKKMSFAGSLKDAVSTVFGWDREMVDGVTKTSREWREQRDEWWSTRLSMDITPRWVLQYVGTEVFRQHFHDDIWVASVEYKLLSAKDDIVITDCRFKNELDAIKRVGGVTLRANRGITPHWYAIAELANKGDVKAQEWLSKENIHASEYSSVGLDYDYQVDNNGTIDELHDQISRLLSLPTSK